MEDGFWRPKRPLLNRTPWYPIIITGYCSAEHIHTFFYPFSQCSLSSCTWIHWCIASDWLLTFYSSLCSVIEPRTTEDTTLTTITASPTLPMNATNPSELAECLAKTIFLALWEYDKCGEEVSRIFTNLLFLAWGGALVLWFLADLYRSYTSGYVTSIHG